MQNARQAKSFGLAIAEEVHVWRSTMKMAARHTLANLPASLVVLSLVSSVVETVDAGQSIRTDATNNIEHSNLHNEEIITQESRVGSRPDLFVPKSTSSAPPPLLLPTTVRNVNIVTYNVQQLPDLKDNDNNYYDENGVPLTDLARAALIATNLNNSDAEIVVLNEVFDENSRDVLSILLNAVFPYHVDYIGNDWDVEDSGLMLFSRYPFEEMDLSHEHVYDPGDVEIVLNGDLNNPIENPKTVTGKARLGFVEFDCSESYGLTSDCFASKGAGIVKVGLPNGESLFVVFTHMVASYSDDGFEPLTGSWVSCDKSADRQESLRRIGNLIKDATEKPLASGFSPIFDPYGVYVTVLGDLNINGNRLSDSGKVCENDEWERAFQPSTAEVFFTSCGDWNIQACFLKERVLTDGWAFDTSLDDLGRTNGFDFFQLPSTLPPEAGNRLDYILYRGPSQTAGDLNVIRQMIPQHLTIAWDLSGSSGELSDHLPVAVDMLLPPLDTFPSHTTPRTAKTVTVPEIGDPAPSAMAIQTPSQMQWHHIDGPKGTYTLRVIGASTPVGFEVYRPEDLSRPVKPRREIFREGFIYLLDSPPYYVRSFAKFPSGAHNRVQTGSYKLTVHRHKCTSPLEACILRAGSEGQEVAWPANPVNATDTMWFEFDADEAPDAAPVHEFAAYAEMAVAPLPSFEFSVAEFGSLSVPTDLTWANPSINLSRVSRQVVGVRGNASEPNPLKSFKTYYLQVRRPNLGFTGKVFVSHTTNLTYFLPIAIQVQQEYDDSAHDELRIYMEVGTSNFYKTLYTFNVHQFANSFHVLPPIDEREDGGQPWPAKSLGVRKFSVEMPLILIEDDDEDGESEFGDFLLAHPLSNNYLAVSQGFAMATLPIDEKKKEGVWHWTDVDPLPNDWDDADYGYSLSFRVSHVSPCELWNDIPACN